MTTLGVLLLLCIGAYVCASLAGEAWLRFFPPRVEPEARTYPCSQGCGAVISANVLLFTGGVCLACESVEYLFEQMRVKS